MSFRFDPDLDLNFSRSFDDTRMVEKEVEALTIEKGKKQSSLNHFYQNQNRSLFVRDLPFHTTAEILCDFIEKTLEQPGCVEDTLIRFSHQGKTLQVACVLLRSEALIVDALEKLHGARFYGRDIRVTLYNNKAPIEDSQNAAVQFSFLVNERQIPLVTEEVVRTHMEEIYGPLRDVCIRFHRFSETGIQSGYGFLTFVKESDNERAVDEMQKKMIHNLQFDCRWSSKCKPVSAPGTLRNKRLMHLAASTPTYGTDALVALQHQSETTSNSAQSHAKSHDFSFLDTPSLLQQRTATMAHSTNDSTVLHNACRSSVSQYPNFAQHSGTRPYPSTAACHHSSLFTRNHPRATSPPSSHSFRPSLHNGSCHQQNLSQQLPGYPPHYRDFPVHSNPATYPGRDYHPSSKYSPMNREEPYKYPSHHPAVHAPRYNVREDLPPSHDMYHLYDDPSPREYERNNFPQRLVHSRPSGTARPYYDDEDTRDTKYYNHSSVNNHLELQLPYYEKGYLSLTGEEVVYDHRPHLPLVHNGRQMQQAVAHGHSPLDLAQDRHHWGAVSGVLPLNEQSKDSLSSLGRNHTQQVQDNRMMQPELNASRFDIHAPLSMTASIPLPLSLSRQYTDDTVNASLTSSGGSMSHLSSSLSNQLNNMPHKFNRNNNNYTLSSESIPISFQSEFRPVGIGMKGNEAEVASSDKLSGSFLFPTPETSLFTLGGASSPSLHSQLTYHTNSMIQKVDVNHLDNV